MGAARSDAPKRRRRRRGARRVPGEPADPTFPTAVERKYTREAVEVARTLRKVLAALALELRGDFDALQGRDDSTNVVRLDGLLAVIRKIRAARKRFGGRSIALGSLEALARDTDRSNRRAVSKVVGEALALSPSSAALDAGATIKLPTGTRRVASTLEAWVGANSKLIKNVPDQTWREVEAVVRKGFREGLRHEVVAKQLLERGLVAESRARLIARDQIGKLTGQLTEARNRDLGITSYTWRTVGDDRVRPSHRALNGQVFEWSDPPAEGHPGQPINCRCSAIPVVAGLLDG